MIANRGEIACRIERTTRRLGIGSVAVYSEADAQALHVRGADEAVAIGAAPARESYLRAEGIIEAARRTGAQAVHPGYGFLSENAGFADACAQAGLVFIGPPAAAIRAMGSKSAAKTLMAHSGVPLVPGYHGEDQAPELLRREADRIGYPVLIKASSGGGGKGMRRVDQSEDFAAALASCQREAEASFGDARVLIEKYVLRPRHIEIQVFTDSHGNGVYLFERDCSVQRRHQKVLEEAPAPGMSDERRSRMGAAALAAARAVGYVGAGTVEFIADPGGSFYFMEMNTRLQVEHPVTEMITGQDLVEWQLRVANGETLPLQQHELQLNGHAMEVRLYAEDPGNNFLPQTGRVLRWLPAQQPNLRIDHGMQSGGEISPHYDPMVAKVIVWGKTRKDACRLLASAVEDTVLLGLNSNKQFLVNLLRHPVFVSGDTNTAFIDQHFSQDISMQPARADLEALSVAAAIITHEQAAAGWQTGAPSFSPLKLQVGAKLHVLATKNTDAGLLVLSDGLQGSINVVALAADSLSYTWDGVRKQVHYACDGNELYLDLANGNLNLSNVTHAPPQTADAEGDGTVRAPMDGAVVALLVQEGDKVVKGQTLIILEAMKIEHQLKANRDGRIGALSVSQKQQVKKRHLMLNIVD